MPTTRDVYLEIKKSGQSKYYEVNDIKVTYKSGNTAIGMDVGEPTWNNQGTTTDPKFVLTPIESVPDGSTIVVIDVGEPTTPECIINISRT